MHVDSLAVSKGSHFIYIFLAPQQFMYYIAFLQVENMHVIIFGSDPVNV